MDHVLIWLDIHLPPDIGRWLSLTFNVRCCAMRDLGMQRFADEAVFDAARRSGAIVMTKDQDFVKLLERWGAPPQVIWLTCGNTSNARLRDVLAKAMPATLNLLEDGEPLVEIRDALP